MYCSGVDRFGWPDERHVSEQTLESKDYLIDASKEFHMKQGAIYEGQTNF